MFFQPNEDVNMDFESDSSHDFAYIKCSSLFLIASKWLIWYFF